MGEMVFVPGACSHLVALRSASAAGMPGRTPLPPSFFKPAEFVSSGATQRNGGY